VTRSSTRQASFTFTHEAEMPKPHVLISRCLLGVPCRYHGRSTTRWGHRTGRPALVERLGRRYALVDICPEVDAGMPTPRPPTRIADGRWICDGRDVTATFAAGADLAVAAATRHHCERAYLLRGSPACDRNNGAAGQRLQEAGVRVIAV